MEASKQKKPGLLAVDLFSGCGGLTLGLKQAGFNVLGAVEIDSLSIETYKANHKTITVKQTDIRALSAIAFMNELGLRPGQLDLLAGCPPCQGFSRLRTKNGAVRNRDKRNGLSSEILRFAKTFSPKTIMMENVPGLVRHKSFKNLCKNLCALGYTVKFAIRDAARFGVPQRRRRLILLAGRELDIKFADETFQRVTVRAAIGSVFSPGNTGDAIHDFPEKRSDRILRLIRDIPKDGGSRTSLPTSRQLRCHKDRDGFKDIYGRMAWDDVAPTITGGCFNPSKGRFLHPEQDRAITLREAALLQGFPRNYFFDSSSGKQAVALMIGNALPPEFIRRHALEIKRSLEKR